MTKRALRAEPLEMVEDFEPVSEPPFRAFRVTVEPTQWNYVRQRPDTDTIDIYIDTPRMGSLGTLAKYRRAFSGWLEAKVYVGGSVITGSGVGAALDPEAVATFIEDAAPQQ